MENSEKILCVISARGGSEGVKGKNIRPLLGKRVIEWAIHKALQVEGIDRVVVSTDSEEIASIASDAGALVPFKRPPHLANSQAGKFQVWQHALQKCEELDGTSYDIYLDIDCTNPLIEVSDICGALNHFRSLKKDGFLPNAVFTVAQARHNPYFNLVEADSGGVLSVCKSLGNRKILARQAAPVVYEHVAGTYVLDAKFLRDANHLLDGRAFGYEISPDKAFDIDSELDFNIIEFLLRKKLNQEFGHC